MMAEGLTKGKRKMTVTTGMNDIDTGSFPSGPHPNKKPTPLSSEEMESNKKDALILKLGVECANRKLRNGFANTNFLGKESHSRHPDMNEWEKGVLSGLKFSILRWGWSNQTKERHILFESECNYPGLTWLLTLTDRVFRTLEYVLKVSGRPEDDKLYIAPTFPLYSTTALTEEALSAGADVLRRYFRSFTPDEFQHWKDFVTQTPRDYWSTDYTLLYSAARMLSAGVYCGNSIRLWEEAGWDIRDQFAIIQRDGKEKESGEAEVQSAALFVPASRKQQGGGVLKSAGTTSKKTRRAGAKEQANFKLNPKEDIKFRCPPKQRGIFPSEAVRGVSGDDIYNEEDDSDLFAVW